MPRKFILLTTLLLLSALGLGLWKLLPPYLYARSADQACRVVIEEMRRQVELPAEAKFASCADTVTVASADGGGWSVFGEYEMPRLTSQAIDRYTFYGNAWQSERGWEATIVASSRMSTP